MNFIELHIKVIIDKMVSFFWKIRIPGTRFYQESDIRLHHANSEGSEANQIKLYRMVKHEKVCHAVAAGSNTQGRHNKDQKSGPRSAIGRAPDS